MIKKIGMKQCVRCGLHLDKDQKLWCSKCIQRVNEELRGEVNRPYEYYFKYHLKQMRKEKEELEKEVERLQKVLYTITGSGDDGEPDLYEDC